MIGAVSISSAFGGINEWQTIEGMLFEDIVRQRPEQIRVAVPRIPLLEPDSRCIGSGVASSEHFDCRLPTGGRHGHPWLDFSVVLASKPAAVGVHRNLAGRAYLCGMSLRLRHRRRQRR